MSRWKDQRGKPVIGLAGGIGSGKSLIARQLQSLGCVVVDADAIAHEVLQSASVKAALREWLGEGAFEKDGSVSRKAVAKRVFTSPEQIERLNGLIHPRVGQIRREMTAEAMQRSEVLAVVWDIPLLFEIGLDKECDAVVFVDAPRELRLARLHEKRGWGPDELARREKLQIPLDKKAEAADYCMDNSGSEAHSLQQVQRMLSQLLSHTTDKPDGH
ncbi:MAG TPA: dephospho-CoA kinase [Phycisphaerae bacterium]|nr:dephospho-CoA kinase [Phycisphaerae bacterium]